MKTFKIDSIHFGRKKDRTVLKYCFFLYKPMRTQGEHEKQSSFVVWQRGEDGLRPANTASADDSLYGIGANMEYSVKTHLNHTFDKAKR